MREGSQVVNGARSGRHVGCGGDGRVLSSHVEQIWPVSRILAWTWVTTSGLGCGISRTPRRRWLPSATGLNGGRASPLAIARDAGGGRGELAVGRTAKRPPHWNPAAVARDRRSSTASVIQLNSTRSAGGRSDRTTRLILDIALRDLVR